MMDFRSWQFEAYPAVGLSFILDSPGMTCHGCVRIVGIVETDLQAQLAVCLIEFVLGSYKAYRIHVHS
jgi:hypothetical protein